MLIVAGSLALCCSSLFAEDIGVVDLIKVISDSPQLAKARDVFKEKFEPREKELEAAQKKLQDLVDSFNKNSPTMKDKDRDAEQQKIIDQQKDLQDMQAKLQKDVMSARDDEMKSIGEKIEKIVNKIAEERKLDAVFTKASVAYNKKSLEITDEVLKRLKKLK